MPALETRTTYLLPSATVYAPEVVGDPPMATRGDGTQSPRRPITKSFRQRLTWCRIEPTPTQTPRCMNNPIVEPIPGRDWYRRKG